MRWIPYLILLFVLLPFVELYLLLVIGAETSVLFVLGLVVITGIIGGILARSQGLSVLQRLRNSIRAGHLPGDALVDGACVLVGGAFLLTPGLITDAIGFILLIPYTRRLFRRIVRKKADARFKSMTDGRAYQDIKFHVHDEHDRG